MVKILLENGVDHQQDDLVPIAEQNNNTEIVDLLNDEGVLLDD